MALTMVASKVVETVAGTAVRLAACLVLSKAELWVDVMAEMTVVMTAERMVEPKVASMAVGTVVMLAGLSAQLQAVM